MGVSGVRGCMVAAAWWCLVCYSMAFKLFKNLVQCQEPHSTTQFNNPESKSAHKNFTVLVLREVMVCFMFPFISNCQFVRCTHIAYFVSDVIVSDH